VRAVDLLLRAIGRFAPMLSSSSLVPFFKFISVGPLRFFDLTLFFFAFEFPVHSSIYNGQLSTAAFEIHASLSFRAGS